MANLTCQTDNRSHHPPRQGPTQEHRQRQRQDKTDGDHSKQHALALFKIALVLQQDITPAIDHFYHRVIRQLVTEHFMKARIQMTQVLGQGKVATPATEIKQLARLGAMVPLRAVVHQQQALQIPAQPCRYEFFFDQVHGGNNAHSECPCHQRAHQCKSDDDPLGKTLPKLHHEPRRGDSPRHVRCATEACRTACR